MKKEHKQTKKPQGEKLIASNRRAYHDFFVVQEYEAGMQLVGTEVKSLRDGQCQLLAAYAKVDETLPLLWLLGVVIPEYKNAGPAFQHEPQRRRKLLLHRREVDDIRTALNERGTTLVPLRIYFKGKHAKVTIGVCRGKRKADKRETIKKRDIRREIDRYSKG